MADDSNENNRVNFLFPLPFLFSKDILESILSPPHRDDRDEHKSGAVGVPKLPGLPGLGPRGPPLPAVQQPLSLLLRLLHGPEEQDVQDHQRHAGDQVHEQHAEPKEGGHFFSLEDRATLCLLRICWEHPEKERIKRTSLIGKSHLRLTCRNN